MSAQSLAALERANEVRLDRAAIKGQIRGGEISVASIVDETPASIETMTVGKLLAAQHRWGVKRTRRFLSYLAISENRTVGHLTERQRGLLIGALEEKAR